MPPKTSKTEAEIRRLAKLEGNKTCADCPEKVPGYVDLTHNVFICTKCSGIHREFQFKVKGVSMTVFSPEDVDAIAAMGNEKFNSIYLSHLNPRDYTLPNGNDLNKLKEFIRAKYIDKRWHRDGRGGGGSGGGGGFVSDVPPASSAPVGASSNPTSESSNRISLKLNTGTKANPPNRRASTGSVDVKKPSSVVDSLTGDLDLLSMSDNNSAPVNQQQSFDPFGSTPSKPVASSSNDPFGSGDFAQTAPKTNGSFDAFGGSHTGADPFDPFGSSQPRNTAGSFDPFGSSSAPAANRQSAFDAFGSPPPQQHLAPMPFIQVNPPAPAPVPAMEKPAAGAVSQPPRKDFGAFDDLLSAPAPAPAANLQTNNPFDSPYSTAAPGMGGAPHAPPPGPYGGHPYGYPPAPGPGYPPNPYGAAYPPQPYGAPGYPPGAAAYPPAPQPYGAPGHPAAPAGYYPPQQPVPNQPLYAVPGQAGPPQPYLNPNPPAQPPVAPAAPDPFAAMSSLAWNSVGGSAPSAAQSNRPPSSVPQLSPAPSATIQQQQPPPSQSVNPFDLF